MESSIEAAKSGDISQPKPALAPKPRLTPKPFSLQKNTSIRSINAPRPFTDASNKTTQKTLPTFAKQSITTEPKPISVSELNTKNQLKATTQGRISPHREDGVDSSVGKLDPVSQSAPPKETPKTVPVQNDDVIQTNHKTSSNVAFNSEQKISKSKEDESQTPVVQKPTESDSNDSSATDQKYQLGSIRKRLPAELTSKFESGGSCPPPLPKVPFPTTKSDVIKTEPADPVLNQTTSEPSNEENNEDGLKEDYSGGGSIKRRISRLFDSSSRPEVTTKREEPEMINNTRGVKERIKNWVTETNSENEKKPQFVPRPRSRSFEPPDAPAAEETSKVPPVELPASLTLTSETVDLPSKGALTEKKSFEGPVEASKENEQQKSNTGEVVLRNRSPSLSQTAADEGDSASSESPLRPLKRDKVKRRSVHFGTVERDDGGPPVPLGSDPDTSEEEGEAPKEETAESIPVSRQVGSFQKKYDEVPRGEEEDKLKHAEFERRRRAEEHEQARIQNEEEQKEREKEKAKQREDEERERRKQRDLEARQKLRLLEEEERERLKMIEEERERQRIREEEERARQRLREEEERARQRLREEEERARQRLREEEERERQREELERVRLKEEERERERLKEEELEREMQRQREERERERQLELMLQRQREVEKERARQEEERLKKELEEREREQVKRDEKLREERERQRQREEEMERKRQIELMLQRQRDEENERAKQEEERLRHELEEREKVRLREEEKERLRQIEEEMEKLKAERERLRQKDEEMQRLKEEKERQRLREEEMERLKAERERQRLKEEEMERLKAERERMRQKEEEMERLRAEKERQRLREEEMERLKEERERQRLKEEEMERLRAERERLRQKEEEMARLKAEIERDRLRLEKVGLMDENKEHREEKVKVAREIEEEREKDRLRQEERERQRLREEAEERERARQKEQQEKKEAMERMREIEMERQRETEERMRQMENERLEELKRKMEEELERKQAQEVREKLRLEEERERGRISRAGPGLIGLGSDNPLPPANNSESSMEVVYDDFSVRQPQTDVDFDDFSVKPKRWGSQVKPDTSPVIQKRWEDDPVEKHKVDELVSMEVKHWENKMPEQVVRPASPTPKLALRSPGTQEELDEVQLISIKYVDEEKVMERRKVEEEETKEAEDVKGSEEDKQQSQVPGYVTTEEDKYNDALIEDEPIQQEESSEQPSEIDSPQPALEEKEEEKEEEEEEEEEEAEQEPRVSHSDTDITDHLNEEEPAPFPESSAPLLDNRLQRSKAVLSKRRTRSRPSRVFRAGLFTPESQDWRTCDSTDEKEVKQKEEEEEEEPKSKKISSSSPSSQRVPMFPGLSPSALLAQLKRRTGGGGGTGGGEETEEDKGRQEVEIQGEEKAAPSPSQLSRSPRTASHMAGAARVLPPLGSADKGTVSSPAWLKELKSKKRLSQHEGEA